MRGFRKTTDVDTLFSNPNVIVRPHQILLATDLRDSSYLLPIAIAQAKSTGAHLTLVHSFINPAASSISAYGFLLGDSGMDAEEFAERILADLVKKARSQGITCDSVVRQGCSPVEALQDEIRRTDAERVIIGTRSIRRRSQQMLGSVARTVLRSLDVPIFAVSPPAQSTETPVVPRRILHPVSLQGFCRENVEVVRRIAEFHNAELILLHAVADARKGNGNAHDLAWAEHQLNALVQAPFTRVNHIHAHIGCGDVVAEILQGVTSFKADRIVLGWNERQNYSSFLESAAYRVMAAASVPVFTLPHHLPHPAAQPGQKKSIDNHQALAGTNAMS